MEALIPHASLYQPATLNETPLIFTRPQRLISHRNMAPSIPNQVTSLLPTREGITWVYPLHNDTPLLNKTPLNINTEDDDKVDYLVRDAGIIDAENSTFMKQDTPSNTPYRTCQINISFPPPTSSLSR